MSAHCQFILFASALTRLSITVSLSIRIQPTKTSNSIRKGKHHVIKELGTCLECVYNSKKRQEKVKIQREGRAQEGIDTIPSHNIPWDRFFLVIIFWRGADFIVPERVHCTLYNVQPQHPRLLEEENPYSENNAMEIMNRRCYYL